MAQLTSNERAFLRWYVRADGAEARRAAYRECRCDGCDSLDESGLDRAIRKLADRPDAQMVIRVEEARRDLMVQQKLAKADALSGQVLLDDAERREMAKDLILARLAEQCRIEKVGNAGLAQLAKALEALTAKTGAMVPLTDAEADAVLKEAGIRPGSAAPPAPAGEEPAEPAPVPPTPVPPKPQQPDFLIQLSRIGLA